MHHLKAELLFYIKHKGGPEKGKDAEERGGGRDIQKSKNTTRVGEKKGGQIERQKLFVAYQNGGRGKGKDRD